ncbi:unnamed protein product [Natator depressus]
MFPLFSQAKCHVKLSMMDDAFDVQYIGCAEEMDGIAPGLLKEEKSVASVFSRVWDNQKKKWQSVKTELSLPKGFKEEHGRAIIAFPDDDFHSELNKAVRGAGTSRTHYMAHFQFKAFHYYLTKTVTQSYMDHLASLARSNNAQFNTVKCKGTCLDQGFSIYLCSQN